MKRPLTVKIAIALEFLKLGLMFLVIVIYGFILNGDNSSSPVVRGMKKGFDNSFGLDDPDPYVNIGMLIGTLLIPIIFSICSVSFIYYRKFVVAVVFVSLEIAIGMAGGIPFLPVAILILICTNPARTYLKNKKEIPPTPPPYDPVN